MLVGAGVAGSAVGHAALTFGVNRLAVYDQNQERAETLTMALEKRFGEGRARTATELCSPIWMRKISEFVRYREAYPALSVIDP